MNSDYTGLLKLLYDWQTIIAGGLALFAGVITYWAGLRGARAVEKQNDILKITARNASAREILVAASIFDGILAKIAINIETTAKCIQNSSPMEAFSGKVIPRKDLIPPPLHKVLNQLGRLNHDIVADYFEICICIQQFRYNKIPENSAESCRELDYIRRLVIDMRENISESRRIAQNIEIDSGEIEM